jgi:uncharacterized membrane protein HdeD (DUF308 family)
MMDDTTSETRSAETTHRLYWIRALAALVWAGLLAVALSAGGSLTPQESVPAFAIALLISYPLIDVIASLIDARTQQRHRPAGTATAQLVNAGISSLTAIAIAVAASHGADAIFRVFGAWAILTGVIQLTLAILRRRRSTPGQWPMILSGGISTLAGLGFTQMATKSELNLTTLAGYATLGAIFFLISAWRLRSQRTAAGTVRPGASVPRQATNDASNSSSQG